MKRIYKTVTLGVLGATFMTTPIELLGIQLNQSVLADEIGKKQVLNNVSTFFETNNQPYPTAADPDTNYITFTNGMASSNASIQSFLSINYAKYELDGTIDLHEIVADSNGIINNQPLQSGLAVSNQLGTFDYSFADKGTSVTGHWDDKTYGGDFVRQILSPDIQVHYVDTNGNPIHATDSFNGINGMNYEVTPLDLSGYKLVQGGAEKGMFSTMVMNTPVEVYNNAQYKYRYLFTYLPDDTAEFWIERTDGTGRKTEPVIVTRTSTYSIPKSTWQSIGLNFTGGTATLFGYAQNDSITYVYDVDSTAAKSVTVKYVDENGKEIATSEVINGNVGDNYDATTSTYQKDVPGYTLDKSNLPSNGTGKLTDQEQTVTYVYKANADVNTNVVNDEEGNVVIRYVDEEGNEIQESEVISGKVGEIFDASSLERSDGHLCIKIHGYILDESKLPNNAKGSFTKDEQTVTYVYKKDQSTDEPEPCICPGETIPDEPDEELTVKNEELKERTPLADTTIPTTHTSNTEQAKSDTSIPHTNSEMPITGEHRGSGLLVLGLSFVAIASALSYKKKKKNNREN